MKKRFIQEAAHAHTDLNLFACVVTLLEGGHIYTTASKQTAAKIIRMCKAEQQKLLRAYDNATDKAAAVDAIADV